MKTPRSDYDSLWKEAIYKYSRPFLEFFFPSIAQDIDWSVPVVEQETELRALLPNSGRGRRTVDALLEVTKISGETGLVLVHIEVQSQKDRNFEERMFLYFTRLSDKRGRPLCSLAILGDTSPDWRPKALSRNVWGCTVDFQFPSAKLLDYPDTPKQPLNPFSWLVAAHRQAQNTRSNPLQRSIVKFRLVRGLYEHGFSPDTVRELFNLMDWVLVLPEQIRYDFIDRLTQFEEERKMVYINSVERTHHERGLKQGREEGRKEAQEALMKAQQGLRDAIAALLKSRWKVVAPDQLQKVHDPDRLQTLIQGALDCKSYQDFLQLLEPL